MTSILTNNAAMSALSLLSQTQRNLGTTQGQISSGLRVANASDNAAYWSIGVGMKSRVGALSAVNDGLSLTKSIADVTATALVAIKDSLVKIQSDVVAAQQPGVDLSAIQSDIAAQQSSMLQVINSASFNGVNWLKHSTSNRDTTTVVVNISASKTDFDKITNGLDPNGSFTFDSTINNTIDNSVDANIGSITTNTQYHEDWSNDANGVIHKNIAAPVIASTGSISSVGESVAFPVSDSAGSGLASSTFSLSPLAMFSSYTGGNHYTEDDYYGGSLLNHIDTGTSTATSLSYQTSGNGILDGAIYLPGPMSAGGTYTTTTTHPSVTVSPTGVSVPNPSPTPNPAPTTTTVNIPPGATTLTSNILTMDISNASISNLQNVQDVVQGAIKATINASTIVGSIQNQVSTQQTFNSALSDALSAGVGSLTDADMNIASTRLQALQTQQQLGIQSLSIANQNSQLVMKLFG